MGGFGMSREKIEVGQRVFLKPINNAARYGNKEIREEVILKAGRKYFSVGKEGETREHWMIKFNIEDLRQVTNYSPDWQLYFSKQEIIDENETLEITREIRRKFEGYGHINLTLDQLRRIQTIINE
jgi:hypothetical protein